MAPSSITATRLQISPITDSSWLTMTMVHLLVLSHEDQTPHPHHPHYYLHHHCYTVLTYVLKTTTMRMRSWLLLFHVNQVLALALALGPVRSHDHTVDCYYGEMGVVGDKG